MRNGNTLMSVRSHLARGVVSCMRRWGPEIFLSNWRVRENQRRSFLYGTSPTARSSLSSFQPCLAALLFDCCQGCIPSCWKINSILRGRGQKSLFSKKAEEDKGIRSGNGRRRANARFSHRKQHNMDRFRRTSWTRESFLVGSWYRSPSSEKFISVAEPDLLQGGQDIEESWSAWGAKTGL